MNTAPKELVEEATSDIISLASEDADNAPREGLRGSGHSAPPLRRIVQISPPTCDYTLCALCDDGTVWALGHLKIGGDKWIRLPEIPQPSEEDP